MKTQFTPLRGRLSQLSICLGIVLFALVLYSGNAFAQSPFFVDDFNRSTLSPGGDPVVSYLVTNSGGGLDAYITSNIMRLTSVKKDNTGGQHFVTAPLSAFQPAFANKLNEHTADSIIWTVNMRYNEVTGKFDGFGPDQKGFATILVADNNDLSIANGYAIVRGDGDLTTLRYRLVKFTGGIDDNAKITSLVDGQALVGGGTPANHRDYMSLKVVYLPATNTWKYYERSDGTAFADPAVNTNYVLAGSVIDDTYTSTAMTSFGFTQRYKSEGTGAWNCMFDNFQVAQMPEVTIISENSWLSSLKVDKENDSNFKELMLFDPVVMTYDYYLTKNHAIPTISGEAAHPAATTSITQAMPFDGIDREKTATIEVTAEDGVTKSTYGVKFIETDYVYLSGDPADWTHNMYATTQASSYGNNKYEGINRLRCRTTEDVSFIQLSSGVGVDTLSFYVRKLVANVAGSFKVSTSIDGGDWNVVETFEDVENLDFNEINCGINQIGEISLDIKIEIIKTEDPDNTGAYIVDDIAYTPYGIYVGNLEQIQANVSLYTQNGVLHLRNAKDSNMSIYTIEGKLVKSQKVVEDYATVHLNKGMYLVRIDNMHKKIVIN